MIIISGIGWVTETMCGCVRKGSNRSYEDIGLLYSWMKKEAIFSYRVKNFGRFDSVSKLTCISIALALHDAGITYFEDSKRDIGIMGTSEAGCLKANLDYFRDYVEAGRTWGRGNLFIYTLPTSRLAEAAIHFGFQGPLLYMRPAHCRFTVLLRNAEGMIAERDTPAMLAMQVDEAEAVCFMMMQEKDSSPGMICSIDEAVKAIKQAFRVKDIVETFQPINED